MGAVVLQFIGLLAYSAFEYHRFTLGIDFAVYYQAASQISHGHLDPYSTIFGYPFVKSHFELIVWPLSLLLVVFRSPFVLLVVQDLSLVGTGLLAIFWVAELVERRDLAKPTAGLILALTTVMVLLNPLTYYSAALDFHIEATATFFAVFGAFDIWSGRHRRGLVWLALCLLCGDLGGIYVVGVGLSATVASAKTRRVGILSMVAGLVWVGIISALGANQGSLISAQFGYLAGRTALPAGASGLAVAVGGVLAHPSRPLHLLWSRRHLIGTYLLPGGVIGILTPWGFGVPVLVLLSSGLGFNPLFIGEPYQQFAVFPFVLFGTMSLLTYVASNRSPLVMRLETRRPTDGIRRTVTVLAMVGILACSSVFAAQRLRTSFTFNAVGGFIPANEASQLRTLLARTPSSTEVIVAGPVLGRFAGRAYLYLVPNPPKPVAIHAATVLLIMDTSHAYLSPAEETMAATTLSRQFHARTEVHGSSLWVLEWSAPPHWRPVVLP